MSKADERKKFLFLLDVVDGWPPVAAEGLPFEKTAGGWKLLVPPLFVKKLSVGDVLAIKQRAGTVTSWKFVRRSMNSTIWLLANTDAHETVRALLERLNQIGCQTVAALTLSACSISVPSTVSIEQVDTILAGRNEVEIPVAYPSFRHPDANTRAARTEPMPLDEFWKLIGRIRTSKLPDAEEEALEPLIAALAKHEVAEIAAFEERLARLLFDIDTRDHMRASGENGDSPDGFLYARCFVVARGRTVYSKVLKSPAAMPKTLDEWCEGLLEVSETAWARRTGRWTKEFPYHASVSYETGSNEAKWPKDDAGAKRVWLASMLGDKYFPRELIEKCQKLLADLDERIAKQRPVGNGVYKLTHATTKGFNRLAKEYEQIETVAREAIAEEIEFILQKHGYDVDIEEAIAPRTW